jgi:hypothetical protein
MLPAVCIGISVLFLCPGIVALKTRLLTHLENQTVDTHPVRTMPVTVEETCC